MPAIKIKSHWLNHSEAHKLIIEPIKLSYFIFYKNQTHINANKTTLCGNDAIWQLQILTRIAVWIFTNVDSCVEHP